MNKYDSFLKDRHWKFQKDSHALFPASNYHWINYSLEKRMQVYARKTATEMGTKMHNLAAQLIELKQPLPDVEKTLNMYVNDAILFDMIPEKQLKFSDEFFGTADAITVDSGNVLRIHDLKTGQTRASICQLEIYAALFCLDCGCEPRDFSGIELRIYQNNDIIGELSNPDDIYKIMDIMIETDRLIRKLKENNDYVYG